MHKNKLDLLKRNSIFAWIAIGTLLLLMVPFSLMTFSIPLLDPGSGMEVINWGPEDFIVMGMMIFGFASLFVLAARKIRPEHRLAVAIAFVIGFFWLWAELAVGVFTDWGS